jgi:hypothetical protein
MRHLLPSSRPRRAALWLRLVAGERMSDVAESIGVTAEGAALIARGGMLV